MTPCNESKFYLKNGRLDLSSLNEDIRKNNMEQAKPQIEDRELAELQSNNITATLEEMALMFEEQPAEPKQTKGGHGDECKNAFSCERLMHEMKEFGIDK